MIPKWHDRALCRDVTDADDVFFPERATDNATTAAVKICARCPVRMPCAAHGADEARGVWGGTTPDQRRKAREGRRTAARSAR